MGTFTGANINKLNGGLGRAVAQERVELNSLREGLKLLITIPFISNFRFKMLKEELPVPLKSKCPYLFILNISAS